MLGEQLTRKLWINSMICEISWLYGLRGWLVLAWRTAVLEGSRGWVPLMKDHAKSCNLKVCHKKKCPQLFVL